MTYDATDTDDDGVVEADVDNESIITKTLNSSIEYLREYADNPNAAGTESDPLNNALGNLLSEKSLPLYVLMGGDYYKESSTNTITSPGLYISGGFGDRPDLANRMGVLAVGSGTSLLMVDGSGTDSGKKLTLKNLWLRQEANDQTGTGLELLDNSDTHLDRVGVHGFDRGFVYDGSVGSHAYNVRSKDCNVALETKETNRATTTVHHYGGYLGNTQGTLPAVIHGSNNLYLRGVTFQNTARSAVDFAGADSMLLSSCWWENNALDNSDTRNIKVTASQATLTSRLTVIHPQFTGGGNVTDNIFLDADLQVTVINPRNPSSINSVTDTANVSDQCTVTVIGRDRNLNLSTASVQMLDTFGRLQLSPNGARLKYDSANGELQAEDDAGNSTTIS